MDRVIIGIAGKSGSGKSFAANFIKETFQDLNLEVVSFAEPLKQFVSLLQLSDRGKHEPFSLYPDMNVREALQKIGTEAMRNNFKEDIWIRALENRTTGKNIIIDDVRFQNEVKWIHDNGGLVIKIKRDDYGVLSSIDYHESEQQRIYVDDIIENDFGDKFFSDLKNKVSDYFGKGIVAPNKSIVGLISEWLKEFRIDTNGTDSHIELYTGLLFDEINELQDEKAGTKEHFHEAIDVIWVAISLALVSGYNPNQIEQGIKILFDSNWSKAGTLDEAAQYIFENEDTLINPKTTRSGRSMVLTSKGKICKGSNYIKPNFDELF